MLTLRVTSNRTRPNTADSPTRACPELDLDGSHELRTGPCDRPFDQFDVYGDDSDPVVVRCSKRPWVLDQASRVNSEKSWVNNERADGSERRP